MADMMDFNMIKISSLKDLSKNMNIVWKQMGNINREVKMIEKEHMEILVQKNTI